MARSDKLYKDSPKLERDGESGEMAVKKSENSKTVGEDGSSAEMGGDTQKAAERRETKHRHITEHLAMHHRHESEHASSKAPSEEMHGRHETELKEMHGRHEKEIKAMHKRHAESGVKEEKKSEGAKGDKTGGEKEIKKTEKTE
jgi:hypothetical protein